MLHVEVPCESSPGFRQFNQVSSIKSVSPLYNIPANSISHIFWICIMDNICEMSWNGYVLVKVDKFIWQCRVLSIQRRACYHNMCIRVHFFQYKILEWFIYSLCSQGNIQTATKFLRVTWLNLLLQHRFITEGGMWLYKMHFLLSGNSSFHVYQVLAVLSLVMHMIWVSTVILEQNV